MDEKTLERDAVLTLLRNEATRHRNVANDYKIKREAELASKWSKLAEELGRIANRIERGEHRSEQSRSKGCKTGVLR